MLGMSPWHGLLVVVLAEVCSGEQQKPYHDCPQYVAEGTTLNCTCFVTTTDQIGTSLQWLGVSNTSRLTVENVSHKNNGTVFTCRLTQAGQTADTTYTLQVAYGPFGNSTSVVASPSPLITNGSIALTLTCNASDVNPEPTYSWTVSCVNYVTGSKVCVIFPRVPADDGKLVACSVVSTFFDSMTTPKTAFGVTNLNMQYPPVAPPVISVNSTWQSLTPGDNFTCVVSGGKPLVSRVVFSCFNLTYDLSAAEVVMADKVDVVQQSSVTSPLTVPSSGPSSVRCTCTAEWTPQPNFYWLSASVDIHLFYPPSGSPEIAGFKQGQAMVYGDTLSCTVYGGRPLVSQVTFSCFNAADQALINDVISDQNDTVGVSSLSSPLTIPRTVTFNITCMCRALWTPRPELYSATSSVTIPIQYPPSLQPVISGYTAGQNLAPQSNLLCTVTGGQPLVSEVIFACFNASDPAQSGPVLSDQQDSVGPSSVSSSLTVPYLGMSEIICFCSAVWTPRRDMYTQNSTVIVALQYAPRSFPVIGYTNGQTLITGDSLNCTVTGGVPLVFRVTFSCFNVSDTLHTSPVIADQTDTFTTTAVSSSVVIPTSVTSNVTCVCNATWTPLPINYTSTASVAVPIQYPPGQDPVISGYTDGQSLKAGDTLSCTVMGGNPLVSQVTFSCYNQSDVAYASAIISDQADNRTLTTVTSSLTVPFTGLTGVVCVCSATWPPRSSLYTRTTRVSIALQYPPNTSPVISGFRAGHEVATGDSLVCTVSGGKPIVSVVTFVCYSVATATLELISDGPDTTNVTTSSVTSYVKFLSSVRSDVTCTCKAEWAPTPEYYQLADAVNVTVKYPPNQDPVIAGYIPGQNLTAGDTLTCTVKGGNPLVSQVIFSCFSLSDRSNTVIADQLDTSQTGGVLSSLTVPSTAISDAVCVCRALWDPVPQLYTRNTSITISPNYPPSTAPVISGFESGNSAITGDNLTCTVSGGKPLVSRVVFSCFNANDLIQSNPVISDQADTIASASVASSLTIPSQATNDLTCICRADWSPKPDVYRLNAAVTIGLQYPPSSSPVVTGYMPGQPMNAGSTLSCAVSGGRPLVSQVIFQCVDSANPANVVFKDQADAVVQSTVYSQVNVTSVGVYAVKCSCTAVWAPRPTLYVLTTSTDVVLQNPPSSPPVISGYTSGQQVDAGSTLTCMVAGGNPLVSQVTFSCYSPANDKVALMADQTDTVDQTSVSSRVTFPDLDLFNVTCVCTAVWSPRPENYNQSSSITVQIQYPPPYPPQISSSRQSTDLIPGSYLSCSVIGGKPLASRVTFSCFDAASATQAVALSDQPDSVSATSVSSPLTIPDTSPPSLTCTCSATWAPRPSWYLTTASVAYSVQSKAKIQSFTINNSPGTVTLNETDKRAATLVCTAQGRPVPTLRLSKTGYASFSSTTTVGLTASSDIPSVQCEHMGTYLCTADNGLSTPDQQAATLVVNCAPRFASGATPSPTPPVLTSSGVAVVLMSYPQPNSFSYAYLGTTATGAPANGGYSAFFNVSCSRTAPTDPVVTCLINATGEPGVSAGFYRLTMANMFGSFAFSFQVEQGDPTGDDINNERDNTTAAIAGSVVAAIVLVFVIVILTVFFCMSRKQRNVHITSHSRITKDSSRHETLSKRHLVADGFYDVTNGVYIADGGMVETRPPPKMNGSVSSQRSRPISSGLFEYKDMAGFRQSESRVLQESGYSTLSGYPSQKTGNGSSAPSSNDDSDKRSTTSGSNGKVRFALPSDDESDSSDRALYATVSKKTKPLAASGTKPTASSSRNDPPLSTTHNSGANSVYLLNPAYDSVSEDQEANDESLYASVIKIEQPQTKKSSLKQPANGNPR